MTKPDPTDKAGSRQPDIPVSPATPAAKDARDLGDPQPPSRHLGQTPQPGMVSQGDMGQPGSGSDEAELKCERRENINPSLPREEPPE